MNEGKFRVLLLCSHPTQYGSPMWRRFAKHPNLDVLVAYCGMQGVQGHIDPGFGVEVAWDVPLLDDYPWVQIKNISPISSSSNFFRLINPGIWKLIRTGKFDAIAMFTGYMCTSFWIALAAAKLSGVPVMYGTDTTTLQPVDGRTWKIGLKRWFWPRLFRMADVVMAPSSGTVALMRSLNIPDEKIQLTPNVVDNDWWIGRTKQADRLEVRKRWSVPEQAVIILFSAKLQPWKRPMDLLRAFARIPAVNLYLVFVGDGPLRRDLESEAQSLGVAERVRFLGFVNQSGLPAAYSAADVLVLPSEYEPFGVVVNEAMLCGCCPVVSDRVGARFDLVRDGETGFTFRGSDVEDLTRVLIGIVSDSTTLKRISNAALERIGGWSPSLNIEATIKAIEHAIAFKRGVYVE